MSLEGEGGEKTIVEMTDKMSAVAFGDTLEQIQDPGNQGEGAVRNPDGPGRPGRNDAENKVLEDVNTATGDVDMAMDTDSEECKEVDAESSKQRAIWDVLEPSEANLNKLDGWSPKTSFSGASGKDGSPDIDTSSVSALENWLKDNLPDDYGSEITDLDKRERRKSRVRWADVETQLQGLGTTLPTGLESSTGGSN